VAAEGNAAADEVESIAAGTLAKAAAAVAPDPEQHEGGH
jgi:hypothetical protein